MSEKNAPLASLVFPSGDVVQPWRWWYQFAPVTINQMRSGDPMTEVRIVQEVASYGKQLGRIVDALSVLIDHRCDADPALAQNDAIEAFRRMAADIETAKTGQAGPSPHNVGRLIETLQHWKDTDPARFEAIRRQLLTALDEDRA